VAIAINLVSTGMFFDVAVRDVEMQDGSLLFSDDGSNAMSRISNTGADKVFDPR
jgi:hypothetical protein